MPTVPTVQTVRMNVVAAAAIVQSSDSGLAGIQELAVPTMDRKQHCS